MALDEPPSPPLPTSTHTHNPHSLPYHEPTILTLITQSSFLLLLNLVSHLLNRFLYCGLVGQILVGVAFGIPGGDLLGSDVEKTIVQLGYLGLILLVYEGGLSTKLSPTLSNLPHSTLVALTGILLPIALSFLLHPLTSATPLQCFAAGAALSATSLGTTFTILSTSGLAGTRLGTVLTSAAMMDDVIGLVMIQIVANLGAGERITASLIVRPVAVSVGLLLGVVLVCRYLVRGAYGWLHGRLAQVEPEKQGGVVGLGRRVWDAEYTPFMIHTLLLLGVVSGAAWAGTSALFAAFLAGAIVSWWDQEVAEKQDAAPKGPESGSIRSNLISKAKQSVTGIEVYERFYSAPIGMILAPLFFASIGFSIPITQMFAGKIIWRGIIYSVLMMVGKLLTGVWILPWSLAVRKVVWRDKPPCLWWRRSSRKLAGNIHEMGCVKRNPRPRQEKLPACDEHNPEIGNGKAKLQLSNQKLAVRSDSNPGENTTTDSHPDAITPLATANIDSPKPTNLTKAPTSTKSLYPATIIGLAMVARGEIGFLIAAVAQSKGIFPQSDSSAGQDLYLIVIWSIVICTLVGPIAVGLMVRRVKRLEAEFVQARETENMGIEAPKEDTGKTVDSGVLGSWGVDGIKSPKRAIN